MNVLFKIFLFVFFLAIVHFIYSYFLIHFIPELLWSGADYSKAFSIPHYFDLKPPIDNLRWLWLKWDSNFYMNIIEKGYEVAPFDTKTLHNWAYFPLFPLIIKALSTVFMLTGHRDLIFILGVIISNIFYALALYFGYKLLELLNVNKKNILIIGVLLIAFPSSYFFHLFYTESTYLLVSVLMFYFLFKKKFLISAIFISLALLTRLNGLALIVPFVYYYFDTYILYGKLSVKKMLVTIITPFIIFIPLLVHFYYMYTITGNFFATILSHAAWNNDQLYPFSLIVRYIQVYGFTFRPEHFLTVVYFILLVLLVVISGVAIFRKKKEEHNSEIISLWLYLFFMVLLISTASSLASVFRISLTVFTIFALPVMLFEKKFNVALLVFILTIFISLHFLFFNLFLLNIPVYGY